MHPIKGRTCNPCIKGKPCSLAPQRPQPLPPSLCGGVPRPPPAHAAAHRPAAAAPPPPARMIRLQRGKHTLLYSREAFEKHLVKLDLKGQHVAQLGRLPWLLDRHELLYPSINFQVCNICSYAHLAGLIKSLYQLPTHQKQRPLLARKQEEPVTQQIPTSGRGRCTAVSWRTSARLLTCKHICI